MNRFEQGSRASVQKCVRILPFIAFVVLFVLFLRGIGSVGDTTEEKQLESLKTAISRSVVQCYAVNGFYPPDLQYLVDHYGLIYDESKYLVDYDAYGSNLIPEVTVLKKTGIN